MSKATPIPTKVRADKLRLCPFCAVCHTKTDLELNHIDPNKPATIDNLIVLCAKHHGVWHNMSIQNRHTDLVVKGIKEAQARGVHVGKPCADYENVIRLICKHSTQFNDIYDEDFDMKTETEIMEMAGVKPVCYAKCKRMLIDAMKSDKWSYEWEKPKVFNNRPLYDRVVKKMREGNLLDYQKAGALNG